jgi:integrating conjugative element membrane protein (TIGR03747 family)
MSEVSSVSRPAPLRPPTLFGVLIALPFQVFGMLCGALLLSILIECIGVRFIWPEQGWHHAQGMLEYELTQLSDDFKHSLLLSDPADSAQRWVSRVYETLFVRSGLSEWARQHAPAVAPRAAGLNGIRSLVQRSAQNLQMYALAAGYIALTFLVRVVVLVMTLPLFALAAFVAFLDGVVQRDIRRFGAGRESGFVYHRARALIAPLALLPWGIYLSFPISIHPLWILLPSAALLSVAIRVTAATFKKYL